MQGNAGSFHPQISDDGGTATFTSEAYVNGTFEGAAAADKAVSLTAPCEASRQAVGERRVALGGHRIAAAMRAALSPPAP